MVVLHFLKSTTAILFPKRSISTTKNRDLGLWWNGSWKALRESYWCIWHTSSFYGQIFGKFHKARAQKASSWRSHSDQISIRNTRLISWSRIFIQKGFNIFFLLLLNSIQGLCIILNTIVVFLQYHSGIEQYLILAFMICLSLAWAPKTLKLHMHTQFDEISQQVFINHS